MHLKIENLTKKEKIEIIRTKTIRKSQKTKIFVFMNFKCTKT